jgi:hypothetical protein
MRVLEDLDSLNFVEVLIHLFRKTPIKPNMQRESFDIVLKLGKQIVRKFIAKDQAAIDEVTKTAKRINNTEYVDYFSMVGLEIISNRKLALGIKSFGINNTAKAKDLLQDAIRLNRNSIIAYWNLARLSVLEQDLKKAKQYYSTVMTLLMIKHPTNYRKYLKIVVQEQKDADGGMQETYSNPIASYQLMMNRNLYRSL